MAYSHMPGGSYVRENRSMPIQYFNVVNEFKMKTLRVMLNLPKIISIVASSSATQKGENMQALSIRFTDRQMEKLNLKIIQLQMLT